MIEAEIDTEAEIEAEIDTEVVIEAAVVMTVTVAVEEVGCLIADLL